MYHGGEAASERSVEMGQTIGLPQEPIGVSGPVAMPEVPAEGGGSTVVP